MPESQESAVSTSSPETQATSAQVSAKMQSIASTGKGTETAGVSSEGKAQTQPPAGEQPKGKPEESPGSESGDDKPKWEQAEEEWLKNKLPADALKSFDPSNEHVKQLVKNAINAEQVMSKAQSELDSFKSKQKATQLAEASKLVKPETQEKPKAKTNVEKFEDTHKVIVDNILHYMGYESFESLTADNPMLANKLKMIELTERQKNWEKDQAESKEFEAKAKQEEAARELFKNEHETARKTMEENISKFKQKTPDIESSFQRNGVNDVLNFLEGDPWYLPKEFVMSNKKFADFVYNASTAIDFVKNLDKYNDSQKKSWEKETIEKEKAKMPPADGSNMSGGIFRKLQRQQSGGVLA